MRFELRRHFAALSPNARVILAFQPLWAIPFMAYNSYASLYMMKLGLSAEQVGLIASVYTGCQIVFGLVAGMVVNRLGRKRSLILFDAVSWLVPMILWAMGTTFWHFLLAAIINATVIVNGMAFGLYLAEDIEPHERVQSYSLSEVVNVSCSLLVPAAGLIIARFGLIPGMRGVYWGAVACMVVMIAGKQHFLTDTHIGRKMRDAHRNGGGRMKIHLMPTLRYVMHRPQLWLLLVMGVLRSYGMVVTGLYLFPFLVSQLAFTDSTASILPSATAIVQIGFLVLVVPCMRNEYVGLLAGLGASAAGALALLLAGATIPSLMVAVNVVSWAAGRALTNPAMQSMVANAIDDDMRAHVSAFSFMFSNLCMLPAGMLGGILYARNPAFPFAFVLGVSILCVVLLPLVGARGRRAATPVLS